MFLKSLLGATTFSQMTHPKSRGEANRGRASSLFVVIVPFSFNEIVVLIYSFIVFRHCSNLIFLLVGCHFSG
jgi:hypothetical protein